MAQLINEPRTVVITGGNTGLGAACALAVASARPNWHVVIASRNQRAAEVAQQIGTAANNRFVHALPLDLASVQSIQAFANVLVDSNLPPLTALICNAGIQVLQGTTYTADGFETTFGVNHLGHFLLTNLLIEHMAADGRIIAVSSGTHMPDKGLTRLLGGFEARYRDPQALAWPERFPNPTERGEAADSIGRHRYGTSKLCNLLFIYELARQLVAGSFGESRKQITANAFEPGLMPGTNLARETNAAAQFAWNHVMPMFAGILPDWNSVQTSGRNLARLAIDPALESVSGAYFIGQLPTGSSVDSHNIVMAKQLWEGSNALLKDVLAQPLVHAI